MRNRIIDLSDAYIASLSSASAMFFLGVVIAIRQGWIVPKGEPVTAAAIGGFFTALSLVATLAILETESEFA